MSNPLPAPAAKTAPSQSDSVELERSIKSAWSVDLRAAASAGERRSTAAVGIVAPLRTCPRASLTAVPTLFMTNGSAFAGDSDLEAAPPATEQQVRHEDDDHRAHCGHDDGLDVDPGRVLEVQERARQPAADDRPDDAQDVPGSDLPGDQTYAPTCRGSPSTPARHRGRPWWRWRNECRACWAASPPISPRLAQRS